MLVDIVIMNGRVGLVVKKIQKIRRRYMHFSGQENIDPRNSPPTLSGRFKRKYYRRHLN
jgi:hypothetical protein